MKLMSNKHALALAMVLSLGLAHQASAHSTSQALMTAGGVKATDYYVVTCSGATHHLFFQIKDSTKDANLVGMTVLNSNGPANARAFSTVDAIGGDLVTSPGLELIGGNGNYNVAVWRTAGTTRQNYTFDYHCYDVNGVHTGTNIVQVSDQ